MTSTTSMKNVYDLSQQRASPLSTRNTLSTDPPSSHPPSSHPPSSSLLSTASSLAPSAPHNLHPAQGSSPKVRSAGSLTRAIDYIYVLWGDHFFESAAVIFATIFREAGLCVKLVGVNGMQAAGRNRILVQADLTVTNALELAGRVCAVVLPCSPAALRRLGNDPRIHQIFLHAVHNGACFFVPPEMAVTANGLKFLGVPPHAVLQYAAADQLHSFVQQLAPKLAEIISAGETPACGLADFPLAQHR